MNVRGRDVLLTAFLKQQVEGSLQHLRTATHDGANGFDTLGLFLHEVGCKHLTYTKEMLQNEEAAAAHLKCQMKVCRLYDIAGPEWLDIFNDNQNMDWLSIGMKHCKEESVGGQTEGDQKA